MYRWVEHTAELELEIEASSLEGVFEDGLGALAELLGDDLSGPRTTRDVAVPGRERAVLLADWLEELVFLAETEEFVPERLAALEVTEDGLSTVVEGRRGAPPPLVKGVTYHDLELRRDNGSWRARIVLDV